MKNERYYLDEEEEIIKAPYYIITYIDDERRTHIALVNDEAYMNYLKERFIVLSANFVDKPQDLTV